MRFDYVIGNPPYQVETIQNEVSKKNGQTPKKNIFHYFQMEADKIASESTVMIYPAGRWIQRSGKGLADFGLSQINDEKLQDILFYPNAKEVFPSAAIADGVSVVVKRMNKKQGGFNYYYCEDKNERKIHMENPGENILPLNPNDVAIIGKIEDFVNRYNLNFLHDRILPRTLFGIESDFVSENPHLVREYQDDALVDFSREVKLFTNDKAGKSGRAKWFVTQRSVIKNNMNLISKWKVVVSSANAGGQKRDNQLEIMDNHSAFGRARVALAVFDTRNEAENFYSYVRSYVARYAFLMTDEALTTLGFKVPDFRDYSNSNALLDFSTNLDEQLYRMIGFTTDEVRYLETTVDNVRG